NTSISSSNVTKLTSEEKATESTSSRKFKASGLKNKNNEQPPNVTLVATDFYLVDNGTVGVAEIAFEKENYVKDLVDGFDQLNKLGAKKLILDMSNNLGGSVSVVIFIISLLFRSQQQLNTFPTSININNFTIPVIEKNFKNHSNDYDFYNPYSYLSFPSGKPFKNASDFIGLRKNLTSSLQLDVLTPEEKKLLRKTSPFPWTSEDIIILTNGICASACALITLFLSEIHNVKTISVGGLLDIPMSFSTFPGGLVTSEDNIADSAGDTNVTSIPNSNSLLLTIRKAYDFDKKSNEITGVLEYLFKPADYRFYYNESNARDSSFLWVDAANILNKKKLVFY
ncbi:6270_t:CDS:2, partial [Dentiscutata heterogama]